MRTAIAVLSLLSVSALADDARTTPLQADTIARFTGTLATQHVAHAKLDDAMSGKIWQRLLEDYDEEKCYFTQPDIRAFEPMRDKLDDALRAKDASFGFDVYDAYVRRVRACAAFATNHLARIAADPASETAFRGKTEGEYTFAGDNRRWPETDDEMRALWKRKLRAELLERLAEAELDKRKSGGKAAFADIARELSDDYEQQLASLGEPDLQEAFERFMMAVGMVNDPHTLYLSPAMQKVLKAELTLSFCGIGVSVDPRRSGLYVLEVKKDGPAGIDGRLKPGDRIVGIGESSGAVKSVKGMSPEKAVRLISGKKGTKVALEVVAASGARKRLELVRDTIKLEHAAAKSRVENVALNGRDFKLGYLRLPAFYGPDSISLGLFLGATRRASTDVEVELGRLSEAGVQGLAMDLRGNGGGMLLETLMLGVLFVKGGPLAQLQNGDKTEVLHVSDLLLGVRRFDKPMVVLVDRASASASELLAGLLQDRGRAVIIGDRRTHGKGTMQGVLPLGRRRGEAVVTMGLFYRITGSSTQIKGVESDIALPSILDGIDRLGENNLPGALPWRKVDAAQFTPDGNASSHVPELARRSRARRASSAAWRAHEEKVRAVAKSCNRKSMSLDYATAKERKRIDRESGADRIGRNGRKASVAQDVEALDKDGMPLRGKDAVLDEALNVLADLVELSGDGA